MTGNNAISMNPSFDGLNHAQSSSAQSMLPENDGMRELRQKLQQIRDLVASTDDKAKQMHQLMSHHYLARHPPADTELDTAVELDHHATRAIRTSPPTAEELRPTFCQNVAPIQNDDISQDPGPVYGCDHYQRNVKVQCYDCQHWYTCRHCHDQAPDLPWPHRLNRKATQNMLCMLCQAVQPAGSVCDSCGVETAYYYCDKCKLWDNDSSKRIYHCDDCGICRRGEGLGRDYIHCKRCNVCITIGVAATHPCIERATDCDCPLCLEYLYTSNIPVLSLYCGHYMHSACYKELMNVTYRCPICNKSAVNMELQWRKLDDEIAMQPMPEADFEDEHTINGSPPDASLLEETDSRLAAGLGSLQVLNPATAPSSPRRVPRKVWVGCNDCGGRGWAKFHWLGLKCEHCDGYNTMQMTPIGRLETSRPRAEYQRQHDLTGAEAIRSFGGDIEDSIEDGPESNNAFLLGTSPSQDRSPGSRLRPIAVRPYFRARSDQPRQSTEVHGSLEVGSPSFLPYDLLQRVSRSLSPMRSYLEGIGPRETASAATSRISQYAASLTGLAKDESHSHGKRAGKISKPVMGGFEDDDDANDDDGDQDDELDSEDEEESDDELDWSDSQPDADPGDEDDMDIFGHR